MNKAVKAFAVIFIYFIVLSGCQKKQSLKDLNLPTDSPMTDANKYAVIIETYISLKDKPGADGITLAHARCKDIFTVTGIQIIQTHNGQELWVHLDSGWIPRNSVQIYSSRAKAETASKKIDE